MSNESHGKFECVYAQLPNLRNKNSIFPQKGKKKFQKHTSPALLKKNKDKLGHGIVESVLVPIFPTNLHKVLPFNILYIFFMYIWVATPIFREFR